MKKFSWHTWIQNPRNLAGLLLLGLILSSSIFNLNFFKAISTAERNTNEQVQSIQLSSIAETHKEVSETNYRTISALSNTELITVMEKSKKAFLNRDYSVSLERIQAIEQRSKKQIPRRFEKNPIFKLLEQISESSASTDYEDLIVCDSARQYYEKQLPKFPKLNELLKVRDSLGTNFSTDCVIYSMKQFNMPRTNFANCPRAMGGAQLPGAKPCVTPNLVNLTHNSFVDATECLNINPKLLMPKLDFESGFFLNAYGSDREGGIGQLTRPAISEVNNQLEYYMAEIEKAASTKKSCANLLKYREYLTKVPVGGEQRCSVMGLPENPLRNIFYTVLFNRINMDRISGISYVAGRDVFKQNEQLTPVQFNANDEFGGYFKAYEIKNKLVKMGFSGADMHFFKNMMTLLGYNTGAESAVKLLSLYLDKRIENNLPLTWDDFNFNQEKTVIDISGEKKSSVDVARSYVLSAFVNAKDSEDEKLMKIKRRRELPRLWASSFRLSFAEFLTYRANSYDGVSMDAYSIYGFPGYLSVIADRNKNIRELFKNSDLDPNLCSDPDFLKVGE